MAAPAPPRSAAVSRQANSGKTNTATTAASNQRTPTQILAPPRSAPTRLKVIIRRLPPGLTEPEFARAIGAEWIQKGDKADWFSFHGGKVSKDPSKPSRPGRAYIHLTKQEHVATLSSIIRDADLTDTKGTAGDSCLLGPPAVEYAPYARVPTNKPRKDARQGTIDQDSEFIDFLQDLTNPVTKPAPLDAGSEKENKPPNEVVTPLVQFLRDKKANKGKEPAPAKSGKQTRQENKENKSSAAIEKSSKSKGSKEASAPEKKTASAAKVEKVAREAVKVLSKPNTTPQKGVSSASSQSAKSQPASTPAETSKASAAPAQERKRGKVGIEAKSLLQRDLGLGGSGGRRRRGDAQAASSEAVKTGGTSDSTSSKAAPSNQSSQQPTPPSAPAAPASGTATTTAPTPTATSAAPSTGSIQSPSSPTSSRSAKQANAKATTSQNQTLSSAPIPSTRAFLKHANLSQGITESLLTTSFSTFGTVKKVEVDKKKGFAYVDFTEADSLRKAIAASPVKVAEGQVTVLERKENKSSQGRGSGRGGGTATTTTTTTSTAAPASSASAGSNSGAGGSGERSSRSGRGGRGRSGRGGGRGEKGGDKSADKSADKSGDKSMDKLTGKSADKSTDNGTNKTTDKSTDKITDESTDKSIEKMADKGKELQDVSTTAAIAPAASADAVLISPTPASTDEAK